jgi:DNA repair photolyase
MAVLPRNLKRIDDPPSPFDAWQAHADGDWLDSLDPAERDRAQSTPLVYHAEEAKEILSENKSPDLPFRWSLNPYRGCFHACAYCYARPSHQYWGFGAGTDFDRQIIVKVNAVEKLRETFMRRSWTGEVVVFSGNTDCYQPAEAHYRLTRGCLEVCAEFGNPVGIITKGVMVRRDIDVLQALVHNASVHVTVSVAFMDDREGAALEPGAPLVSQRFRTIELLALAGIPVGISLSPMIPGLNDSLIPQVLKRASEAGATRAFIQMLRLPKEVNPVFESRLRAAFPDRADRVLHAVEDMRGGKRNSPEFGERMIGHGPRWEQAMALFKTFTAKYGFNSTEYTPLDRGTVSTTFRRPEKPQAQMRLF